MKHYLPNSLRALFLSLAVLLSLPMLAVEIEIDGINYDLNADAKQAIVPTDKQVRNNGRPGTLYTFDEEKYREQIENRNAF